ncbi:MAG: hypothetical protein JRH18_11575 [Deltaproteobacteria bacterium]|nr:hypothetical protein [Deltaproteobacteria bacterium]MBW2152297.1 hypothetical protein [Deltaproteobacteria bacterium]
MDKYAIIVTVGTSLFHSATWEWKGKPEFMDEAEWKNYQYFLTPGEGGGLNFPKNRQMRAECVEKCFRNNLRTDNAEAWSSAAFDYSGGDPKYRRRFSAEITSLLAFAEKFQEGAGWKAFLRAADIFFACNESGDTYECAEHLRYIYRKLIDGDLGKIHRKPLVGFSSTEPEEILNGLNEFDKLVWELIDSDEKYAWIHIIVSGGYKVYAIKALNHLPSRRLKVHYMHEDADIIFTHSFSSKEQGSFCLPVSVEM